MSGGVIGPSQITVRIQGCLFLSDLISRNSLYLLFEYLLQDKQSYAGDAYGSYSILYVTHD